MLQYNLTPDILLPLSAECVTGGDITIRPTCIRPRFAEKKEYAALWFRENADRVAAECGLSPAWIAWYEYLDFFIPRVMDESIKPRAPKEKTGAKQKDAKYCSELDTMIISSDFTALMCCNHYMKTKRHKITWWWRCGLLQHTSTRLKLRYTGHIIRPPREYSLDGRLAQIFNRTAAMKPNVVIVDCEHTSYRSATISALQHMNPGTSLVAKLPASKLWDPEASSVLFTLRQLFASTYMLYSQADASVCVMHIGLSKKIAAGLMKALAKCADGKTPSLFGTAPSGWDSFVESYNALLKRISDTDSAALPVDFLDSWNAMYGVEKIDSRLHLVDDAERALSEL